jgi:hypothetical protein
MRIFVKGILLCSFFSFCAPAFSQRPQIKYGDIKPEDFDPSAYAIDSSASAVVLFDVGSATYQGDAHGSFSIAFKKHTRIRLLNRNSFDLASITIPLYASGTLEEKIENLEATTYNIENGKVESFKLDKASIFKDRLNKNFTVRKFTLPNLKEGSIIEIKYSLLSPYEKYLRSWDFQGNNPVLWSEYETSVPFVYDFVLIKQGYHPFLVDQGKNVSKTYNISSPGRGAAGRSQSFTFTTNVGIHTWAMKDVPPLKKENFTTTLDNHIAKIDFQLSRIQFPDEPVKEVMNNWYKVSEDLLKDPDFGEGLTKNNNWIHDELKKVTAGAANPYESAKRIFNYIRDNMSCTDHSAKYLSNPLKKVYQTKNGNVADINLLLTAFLMEGGFEAHPVLLSTRAHRKTIDIYPLMDRLNYVITQLKIDNKTYLLDASQNRLGFGHLTNDCYNGSARIIDAQMPSIIDLSADSIRERKFTSVFIINNDKGGLAGSFRSNLGNYESQSVREKLAKTSKHDFFKEIKKDFSLDVEVSNEEIDSLKIYEAPIAVKYDFTFDAADDVIYINPVFGEALTENPFKALERLYPVEMPYAVNENYVLKMDIPKGYTVEELPKSCRVKFNDDEGVFEYLVGKDENCIQLRSTLKLNKANFLPEDYQGLRDFFGHVVKKHSEQIVFKKIN